MKLYVDVPFNGINYRFDFLTNSSSRLVLDDVFIIDCFKVHSHSYYFRAFFYKTKRIYSDRYFNSKSKMYRAVQDLLKEELSHV